MLKKIQTIYRQEGLFAIFRRVWAKLLRKTGALFEEAISRRKGSYSLYSVTTPIKLAPRLGPLALKALTAEECIPQEVAQHYIDHRFDLLGSGWTQVRYGMRCRGMAGYRYEMGDMLVSAPREQWLTSRLNPSNLAIAQHIWQKIDPDYQPIDWQLDFKSGYRWSEQVWADRLAYGHLLGVDVKVPWELARMQHLPQMALRAGALGVNNAEAQRLVGDIRNQLLDFIANNPPGFGVNWICPMDVAIRGANWCLAWDILQAAEFPLDSEDESILTHSLYDHGRFIVRHLEWSNERANHYLADVCGLAFISAYLTESCETDGWLAFAIGQLHVETLRQFLPDGGNFEGSTAYHRLSTEMVLYGTALIVSLPQERLKRLEAINPQLYAYLPKHAGVPESWTLHNLAINAAGCRISIPFESRFIERLQLAVSFFATLVREDGSFPQIGDNDSGRFFKIHPVYSVMTVGEAKRKYLNLDGYAELDAEQPYYFEEPCQGGHLIDAATGLGLSAVPTSVMASHEYRLIANLTNGCKLVSQALTKKSFLLEQQCDFNEIFEKITSKPNVKKKTFKRLVHNSSHMESVRYLNFADFGLHVWRSNDLTITLRSIENENFKTKGHFHDDQLGVEITINGYTVIRDLGTYVYTALPAERNRYRSRRVHFPSSSTKAITSAAFEPPPLVAVRMFYAGVNGFAGSYVTAGSVDYLVLFLKDDKVDFYTLTESDGESLQSEQSNDFDFVPFSTGYGIQERI